MEIKVMSKILQANDAWAQEIRQFLKAKNSVMLNIIGSPGAGKTTLLEKTIEAITSSISIGVIEGDIATTKDAERIKKKGVPVFQINTGTACHLDAHLVFAALKELGKKTPQLVYVENIGNLVCPAEFDIGEHAKIAVLSVTEGDDKVEKYPLLFTEAKALVVSKKQLLQYTNCDLKVIEKAFRKLNKTAPIMVLDSLTGEGFDVWTAFIRDFVTQQRKQ